MQEEPQKKRSISYWLFPLEPVHSTVKVLPQKTQQRRHRGNRDPSCGNTNDWVETAPEFATKKREKKKESMDYRPTYKERLLLLYTWYTLRTYTSGVCISTDVDW